MQNGGAPAPAGRGPRRPARNNVAIVGTACLGSCEVQAARRRPKHAGHANGEQSGPRHGC